MPKGIYNTVLQKSGFFVDKYLFQDCLMFLTSINCPSCSKIY